MYCSSKGTIIFFAEVKKQGAIVMENKIILIEDDVEIREMISDYLLGEFEVTFLMMA